MLIRIFGASGDQKKGFFSISYLFACNICSPSIVFVLTMTAINVKNYEKDINGETTTLTILPIHIFSFLFLHWGIKEDSVEYVAVYFESYLYYNSKL